MMHQVEHSESFGKIRGLLWPIHSHELKKLFSMLALFFLIAFVYNVLRCMKMSLIVTADGSGAEVIPYLKTLVVLPGAFLLTFIFTKLVSCLNREQVFYIMLFGFLAYFALFLFILYPNHQYLQLDDLAAMLESSIYFKEGYRGLVIIIKHWNLALFYVLAEMWSAVVLSMLFWGFANEVIKVSEAKRFYAFFALGANAGAIATGFFVKQIEILAGENWVSYQLSVVLVVGGLIIALFYWLNRSVFHMEKIATLKVPKKSKKISLKECFSYMSQSKYLAYMVIIVVAYNIVHNLVDVMWSYKVKEIYQSSQAVNAYFSKVTSVTGFIAVIFALFISGNTIRYYSWTIAAFMTPVIWLIGGLGFFGGLLLDCDALSLILPTFIDNPAMFILVLGSMQVCFGRACKYTVFDETKEIAFIPLPIENQLKSKAIVDGLASRFGKSGGSVIYLVLLLICGDLVHTIPYVAAILFITVIFWLYAVRSLGIEMNTVEMEKEEKPDLSHEEAYGRDDLEPATT